MSAANNAYGKRNLFLILFKKIVYLIFRGVKSLFKKRQGPGTIVLYRTSSQEEFSDYLSKLTWFIPDEDQLANTVMVCDAVYGLSKPSPYLSEVAPPPNAPKVKLVNDPEVKVLLTNSSIILLTHFRDIFNLNVLKNIGKIEIVDPYFFSYVESITWQNLFFNAMSSDQVTYYREFSLANFKQMSKDLGTKNSAVCFVTGPSFDTYKQYDLSSFDLKIICNSVVKNEEFLEYVGGADILAFADPVFHFGPSKYAASFREQMVKIVKKYHCYVFVPIKALPLILKEVAGLEHLFIGIDYVKKGFNFPSAENLSIKDNGNVLTNLMLPLSSVFATSIYIFGADGRNKSESYFWNHSKSAQFGDLMETAFQTHPSFFRDRVYTEYYDQHCKTVEELLQFGRDRGKDYHTITPSFIPALTGIKTDDYNR
ncbi:hypothetical protein [Hufsiella ginkgonis]|uniref:Uncharacterized protein n=1 Tax=Hufsiella ginkgonis TaxID=2695274 RepID=A0A7K1Y2C8_9SPHI|nr:hypothetical protein [Hufsiella ginkgonis]MXV17415.1 hypothetical protein [Hufsiella ginkgonis]